MSAMTLDPVVLAAPRHKFVRGATSRHLVPVPAPGRVRVHTPTRPLETSGRPAAARLQVDTQPMALRLTRRGRLAITSVVALLLVTVAVAGGTSAWAGAPTEATTTQGVTVLPGQSLWSIAMVASPDADPRDTIIEIQELNDLAGSRVFAGQRLVIPVG